MKKKEIVSFDYSGMLPRVVKVYYECSVCRARD